MMTSNPITIESLIITARLNEKGMGMAIFSLRSMQASDMMTVVINKRS
ncbi:MAG: hypothetical protein ACE5EA_06505 [Nitrospirota bacterium]